MIRLRMDFFSESLGMGTSAVVLLPQAAKGQIGMGGAKGDVTPVLYLLHGLSDDCTTWERRTSIERYASRLGLAVVMPEVRKSFYTNEVLGDSYYDFVAQELPELINSSFNLGHTPENSRANTFVAGLSMGGFGAMKLALNQPERFAAAGSFSGALNPARPDFSTERPELARRIWGYELLPNAQIAPEDNLLGILQGASEAEIAQLPDLWVGCGKDDFLLDDNLAFLELAAERGVQMVNLLTEGAHTWEVWDSYVEQFLEWISPKILKP